MTAINYDELMIQNPEILGTLMNQLGQDVIFYENPEDNGTSPVIAVIDGVAFVTDFWDISDFFEGSEYNPCLVNDEIGCHRFINRQLV